jgi:hypothetical protein
MTAQACALCGAPAESLLLCLHHRRAFEASPEARRFKVPREPRSATALATWAWRTLAEQRAISP